ncbi:hypothetical protein [Caulobacter hibisci]|uniref:Uncharacterized protein n=1 Tax=Caulobacter hibisci TaxID=2035993 RepID=A0ABS0T0X6_9CAUL|nr:hypothetical protein [Caulobacter hibisci]MBI1685533.1 hypothetical protein [Caulobacter hibisci]
MTAQAEMSAGSAKRPLAHALLWFPLGWALTAFVLLWVCTWAYTIRTERMLIRMADVGYVIWTSPFGLLSFPWAAPPLFLAALPLGLVSWRVSEARGALLYLLAVTAAGAATGSLAFAVDWLAPDEPRPLAAGLFAGIGGVAALICAIRTRWPPQRRDAPIAV